MGPDLFNLLVDEHVNLVLQGHEHAYMRSKPFMKRADCKEIMPDKYNKNCIAPKGSAGTVLVINGTGGFQNRDLNFNRPAKNYFSAWHGKNADPLYGTVLFKVTASRISAVYLDESGKKADSFTVR
jgi:hypothetical protein